MGVEVLTGQKRPGVQGEQRAREGLPAEPLQVPAGQGVQEEEEEAPTVEL